MVDQKIYLDIFALLCDLETRWRVAAGYFREQEKIVRIYFILSSRTRCGIQGLKNKMHFLDPRSLHRRAGKPGMTSVIMKNTFSQKVVQIVSRIPKGKTLAYKQVAKKAGNEKAARAVGNILNRYYFECLKNKKPTIPCHRIVRSDGKIGGYAKGEKEKRKLLQKEKVT